MAEMNFTRARSEMDAAVATRNETLKRASKICASAVMGRIKSKKVNDILIEDISNLISDFSIEEQNEILKQVILAIGSVSANVSNKNYNRNIINNDDYNDTDYDDDVDDYGVGVVNSFFGKRRR